MHLLLSSSIVSETYKKQLGMVSQVMASHNMPSSSMNYKADSDVATNALKIGDTILFTKVGVRDFEVTKL
jgi:hypothetical protein